MSVANLFRRYR